MAGQTYIKKGYLDSCPGTKSQDSQKQEWKHRFYVLYSSSESNKARLDWFNDEEAFRQSPTVRKTIFVEEITKINYCNLQGREHGFQFTTLRRDEPFLFSAPSKQEKKSWTDCLKDVVEQRKRETPAKAPRGGEEDLGEGVYGNQLWGIDEKPIEYDVTVGETPSAQNCNLNNKKRTIHIFQTCMALVDPTENNRLLFVWPYRYIRRYGRSRSSFTFETGRRCASGEGVFILLTPQAEDLFLEIQNANAKQNAAAKDVPAHPSLPVRGYGEHYGEIVNASRQGVPLSAPDYTKLNQEGDWSTDPYKPKVPSKPVAEPPNALPEQRERSLSSSSHGSPSSRVPRPVLPLPPQGANPTPKVTENYSDPVSSKKSSKKKLAKAQQQQSAYSDVPDPMTQPPATIVGTSEYGYAEPVTPEGSSMSAVVAQLRMNGLMGDSDFNEDEYDRVTLNVMKSGAESGMDQVPEAYGQLYDVNRELAKAIKSKNSNECIYQEVGEHG